MYQCLFKSQESGCLLRGGDCCIALCQVSANGLLVGL